MAVNKMQFVYHHCLVLLMFICTCSGLSQDTRKEFENGALSRKSARCTRPDGTPGKCVDHYLCDDDFNIITDGSGQIYSRTTNPIEQRIWSFGVNGLCPLISKCCSIKSIEKSAPVNPRKPDDETMPSPEYTKNCGKRNAKGINSPGLDHVSNNNDVAKVGEFPWMILIMQYHNKTEEGEISYMYQCGGSLIHPRVVLTSANCVAGKEMLSARAGEWNTTSKRELMPHQDREVSKIIIHEDFNPDNLHNDIAILLMDSEFKEVDNVGVVCLPSADIQLSEENKKNCYSSGWGTDAFQNGFYQAVLKKTQLPIVDHNACQEKFRGQLGVDFNLDKSFICAGGEPGKDTCKGDGGSPLSCPMPNNPGVYIQLGIVSWGIDCGTKFPSVNANVIYLRRWIDKQLCSNKIDMQKYISP